MDSVVNRSNGRRQSAVRCRALLIAIVGAALVFATLPAEAARGDEELDTRPGTRKKTRVNQMKAAAGGGQVKVTGWATFSGQIMASTDDPKDDGGAVAETEGGEIIGSDFIYRPENEDFFWRLEVTKIPTAPGGVGVPGVYGSVNLLYVLSFDANGKSYEIRAHRLGNPDVANSPLAPAEPAFGLFECDENLCELLMPVLKGGYGTTGERIVVALPLQVLHDNDNKIKEGDKIGGLIAVTCIGQFLTGCPPNTDPLDDANLLKKSPSEVVPVKSVTVTVGRKSVKANLKDGYFDASFPAKLFRKSPTTVKTKTCLGKQCKKQKFKVRK